MYFELRSIYKYCIGTTIIRIKIIKKNISYISLFGCIFLNNFLETLQLSFPLPLRIFTTRTNDEYIILYLYKMIYARDGFRSSTAAEAEYV